MKLLNKLIHKLDTSEFDVTFESQMVQSRIISVFLEIIEFKNLTQQELVQLTGLSQPFLSAIFNNRKKLNVEHIAKLQKALGVILQPPTYLSKEQHHYEYYNESDYSGLDEICRLKNNDVIILQLGDFLKSRDGFKTDNNLLNKNLTPKPKKYEFA
ncbi:helix-turn-helix domain-containing protein [Flavobacterium sp. 3HN19-14]|uniref:helix-turn-helix domain-containing protein n=1 Tax=Flavobacterium sp. 3HN19-14 TaxID=3448133 RepID=UPI003EDF3623